MASDNAKQEVDITQLDVYFTGDGVQTDIGQVHDQLQATFPNICVRTFEVCRFHLFCFCNRRKTIGAFYTLLARMILKLYYLQLRSSPNKAY